MQAAVRLEGAARKLTGLFADRALILLYHRVAELPADPWSLAVTPAHFAEHIEVLRRLGQPLSLRELAAAVRRGIVPPRGVVVTFDDGYADNLHCARPLLERFEVPATVFVASAMLGGPREFWWDELERVLLSPGTLPRLLRLTLAGKSHRWSLGEAAHYGEAEAERHRAWRSFDPPPTERHRIYIALWRLLQPLSGSDQSRVLDQLLGWAGLRATPRPGYRMLTPEEVPALASGELVEIGGHTLTHPRLASLVPELQQREIRVGRLHLEELVGRPVTSFAYPFGGSADYTRTAVRLVKEAGFTCACASYGGATTRFSDPYQLPRLYMRDMDGDEFEHLLARVGRVR